MMIDSTPRERAIEGLKNVLVKKDAAHLAAVWLNDPMEWVREAARRALQTMNAEVDEDATCDKA